MVSIICNTYNHQEYIKDALDGFLMQKTDFPIEILIHDDASTDNTTDIIREYEKKYPNIIKPIYQTENQYSKGVDIIEKYQYPRVKGKYIALCEGDDYWIDENKLEKQFKLLEENEDVDICAHAANVIDARTKMKKKMISPSSKKIIFSVKDVIKGGGAFVVTNTLFYRSAIIDKEPDYCLYYKIDYALQICGSMRGGMLYIPDTMSTYREMVCGSWTERVTSNMEYMIDQQEKVITMLNMVNEETNGKYASEIRETILEFKFDCLLKQNKYKMARTGETKQIYKTRSLCDRMYVRAMEICPRFIMKLKKIFTNNGDE